jgi:hypothetical protein
LKWVLPFTFATAVALLIAVALLLIARPSKSLELGSISPVRDWEARAQPRDSERAALEGAVARAAVGESPQACWSSLWADPGSATAAVAVHVAEARSPAGLRIEIVNDAGARLQCELDDEGMCEFKELPAGRYWLLASGNDDVVWKPQPRSLWLEEGQREVVDWGLAKYLPSIAEFRLLVDGAPAHGMLIPSLDGENASEPVWIDATGRGVWRTLGHGPLSTRYFDTTPSEAPSRLRCIGATGRLGTLQRGRHTRIEVRFETSLVRVLPPRPGVRLSPAVAESWQGSVEPCHPDAEPHSAWIAIRLDLDDLPLATFRASPGCYIVRTRTVAGEWEGKVEVAEAGTSVDCRLEPR